MNEDLTIESTVDWKDESLLKENSRISQQTASAYKIPLKASKINFELRGGHEMRAKTRVKAKPM